MEGQYRDDADPLLLDSTLYEAPQNHPSNILPLRILSTEPVFLISKFQVQ